MIATSSTALVVPAFTAMSEIYCGLSIRTPQGRVEVVTVLLKTDLVFYTIDGAGMNSKSQAEFRQTFMAPLSSVS